MVAVLLGSAGFHAPLAWLPAGLGAATLIRLGHGHGPYFALGCVAGGAMTGQPLPLALALGLGSALGPTLLALHLERARFDPTFSRERDFIRFVIAAAATMALTAAAATLLPAMIGSADRHARAAQTWLRWWMTAYLGTLLLVPMIVSLTRQEIQELRQQRRPLLLMGFAVALVLLLAAFSPTPTHGFLVGPLSLVLVGFAALRFHVSIAALVAAVLTCAIGLSGSAAPVSEFVSGMFGLARASAFGLVNALLIFTVQVLRSERLAALRALHEAELRHRQAILQAARLEQVRIGEHMHDEVGQEATALSLLARSIERQIQQGIPVQPADAQAIVEGAKRIHVATRNAVQRLLAVDGPDASLGEALRNLAQRLERAGAPPIQLELPATLQPLPPQVADVLFRTAQEALTNAVKHAQASRIEVTLTQSGTQVELRVRDDGVGLLARASLDGVGLKIMRGRAERVGGRIRSGPVDGAGTEIVLEVPTASVGGASLH